jgi:tRNA A-37 threonylcarbamoyl transferase component Bud32
MSELVGQRLGQYEILEQIAKGGMATVYRATQTSIGRDVAIKVLPHALLHDDTFLERFNREVEIVARLQHPHILPVYDFGEYDGMPFIVMAYLRGGTLADIMAQGPMDLSEVARITRQLGDALDYAHGKGIIHRDFKPGNVLLDEQKNTYLADFGLAKIAQSSSEITGTTILGTPAYMAPEQTEVGEITSSADIYALGVTVFQMITGHVPYEAATPLAILMAHVTQPIPDVRKVRFDVSDAVQAVINKAMAKNIPERYPSAGELAKALTRVVEGSGTDASAESPVALLMTNMLGQVIFVDSGCLKMLKRHHNEARNIIGKPMHEVLGFERAMTDQIMEALGKFGQIDEQPLQIRDSRGQQIPVLFAATATKDDKGGFVGADMSFKVVGAKSAMPALDFETMEKHLDTVEETYLQTYFKAQMEGLQSWLTQMGGARMGRNLESIVNETAQRNVWPVQLQNGKVSGELRNTQMDIYRALLAKAVNYAVMVMGQKLVAKQMQAVDKRLDPRVVDFVKKLGIHDLFQDIL